MRGIVTLGKFKAIVLFCGYLAASFPVAAEKNLYVGINAGGSLFSPGLYSNREILYHFDSLDSVTKTPSILYTVPVVGISISLAYNENWIFGYSGNVARATWLENPTTQKIELKKCGTPTALTCKTLDPHFSPTYTFHANLTRTDHDFSVTRRLGASNWLLFAALRYQYYAVNGERPAQGNNDTTTTQIGPPVNNTTTTATGQTPGATTNYSAQSAGGAVGVGYTVNFFQNWYLNMQAGFLILRGTADYTYYLADNKYSLQEKNQLLGLGSSGAFSLGYSVTGDHILLLSYKFQVFRMSALSGSRTTVDQYGTELTSSDSLFSDGAVDLINTVTLAYIYKVF